MNQKQWEIFCDVKKEFKAKVQEWVKLAPELKELQKTAALDAGTPEYPFENTLVYNRDLDKITPLDDIRLIVIGDNPGKDEQLEKNNRYLVGLAGKIAEGYFKRNPQLGVDFRKNVIILNKTPVHSAKTIQLKKIIKAGGPKIQKLIEDSQIWMAEKTAALHIDLCKASDSSDGSVSPEIWLVGYSELKERGIFTLYRDQLKKAYQKDSDLWEKVFVFQHFSMNCFTKDLDKFCKKNGEESQNLLETLHRLGSIHKKEIFI
ncbi:MAG: hypothetical protein K5866_05365 [Treponema sp.]|nr:hypothetical protein [Treponema sp.]